MEAEISHLKKDLETKIPNELVEIRARIQVALAEAKAAEKGSPEAALAWEVFEELESAHSRMINKRKP